MIKETKGANLHLDGFGCNLIIILVAVFFVQNFPYLSNKINLKTNNYALHIICSQHLYMLRINIGKNFSVLTHLRPLLIISTGLY